MHAPNRVEAVAFVGARENVMEETESAREFSFFFGNIATS